MTDDPYGLFELAPAAYVVFDRAGLIRQANRAFGRLVGHEVDEIVDLRTLSSLLTAGGRIYLETHLMPHLDLNDQVEEVALEVVHADGRRSPVLMSANVHRADDRAHDLTRAVLFGAGDRRRYEIELLQTTRAAERAELRATELSRTLQQTLIPPSPPTIPHLGIAAAYRPAGDGSEVGGDFYDVFNIAERTWLVVLGDVVGKGIPAATVTAFIRHTVRDLAMVHDDPATLLQALDGELRRHADDRFCTIVALRLHLGDEGWDVQGSVGGHPLPLLGHVDGTVRPLGTYGSLVGALEPGEATFETFTHALREGEFVVAYTDGVTEAKRDGDLFGSDRLVDVVRRGAARPGAVTESVVDACLAFQGGDPNDDIAVLTLFPTIG